MFQRFLKFGRIFITNQFFNERANMRARENSFELVEQPQLEATLRETPLNLVEVEAILHADWTRAV